jgi:hypothetical protein
MKCLYVANATDGEALVVTLVPSPTDFSDIGTV